MSMINTLPEGSPTSDDNMVISSSSEGTNGQTQVISLGSLSNFIYVEMDIPTMASDITTLRVDVDSNDVDILNLQNSLTTTGQSITTIQGDLTDLTNVVNSIDLGAAGNYGSLLAPTLATTSKIGGIEQGTTVSELLGKSFTQMFDLLLFPTLLPTVHSGPSLSLSNPGSFFEAGAIEDLTVNITPSKGEIRLNGVKSQDRSGDVTSVSVTGPSTFNVPTVSNGSIGQLIIEDHTVVLGSNNWVVTADFADGPIPLDSTGAAATNISQYTAGTASKIYGHEGVHPILVGTDAGSTEKIALQSHGNRTITAVQNYSETSSIRHQIWVSEDFINSDTVTIQALNTSSGLYENISSTAFSTSNVTFTLHGVDVDYIKYEKQGSLSGANTFKLIYN